VPEFLRVAKFYRLVILGVVIVVMVLFLPQGVVGLATKFRRRRRASVAEAS
jgi:ABC-type branched-subunit amino acid transport system permease subunit